MLSHNLGRPLCRHKQNIRDKNNSNHLGLSEKFDFPLSFSFGANPSCILTIIFQTLIVKPMVLLLSMIIFADNMLVKISPLENFWSLTFIWALECKRTSSSLWNAEQHCPLGWVETKSLGMIKPCNLVRLNKCKINLIKN